MKIQTFTWAGAPATNHSLTVGEFLQGPDYRTVRPSGTDNYLLILTVLGSGRIVSPQGQVLETEPGILLLFEPGSFHDYGTSPEAGRWSLQWSHFLPAGPAAGWEQWDKPWPGLHCARVDPLPAQRISEDLREVLELPAGAGELGGAFALNCLERIWMRVRLARGGNPADGPDPRLHPALVHIMNHIDKPLALELLARKCGLSVSRFAHLFRQELEITPQSFIEARRMELGRNLLLYSDLPVSEVARRCGYENPFYFSTRFRRCQGLSPREFRRSPAS